MLFVLLYATLLCYKYGYTYRLCEDYLSYMQQRSWRFFLWQRKERKKEKNHFSITNYPKNLNQKYFGASEHFEMFYQTVTQDKHQ